MCTRGVFQLRKLSLYFCDFGGSSQGVRSALTSEELKKFMSINPHIEYNFIVKRNHHPFVTGAYLNGYLKDIPLRSPASSTATLACLILRSIASTVSLDIVRPVLSVVNSRE